MNKVGGPARERRVTGHLPSPHYVPPPKTTIADICSRLGLEL